MTSTAVRPANRTMRVLLLVVRAGLTLVFAGAGAAKLSGDSDMIDMFADVGAGQWLRFVVGAAEVAGAVGLWVPRLRVAAALGLAALMVGATVANVALLDASPVLTLALLMLLLGLARLAMGTRHRTGSPPPAPQEQRQRFPHRWPARLVR